ncbi:MAG: hypothetical protein NTZ09_04995 [Candidatus Hydrogenedentes bacterium]|nr:hypothetical protein [Candidatus Hydrogenedentota bacterium]
MLSTLFLTLILPLAFAGHETRSHPENDLLARPAITITVGRSLNADCMMAGEAYAAAVFPVISAYEVTDCRIEDLAVDGNRTENEFINGCRGAGIFSYRADGAVFENCIVREYNGDGISFQQSNDVRF